MKKILWLLVLFIIVNCIQGHNVFARNNENYFKGKVKTIHSKYRLIDDHPIKLQDGRIFFYDGLNILLFDPKTDTFKKSFTTPTVDRKPTRFKNAILLPDGKVLISRTQNYPTWELEKKILKTLKLTKVRNIHKDIFPYIKAYPDLYEEYIRQKKISEMYSRVFIYDPVTETIYFTNFKIDIRNCEIMVLAKNKKVYIFDPDVYMGNLVTDLKRVPVQIYDTETKKFNEIYLDFKSAGSRYTYLHNVFPLNDENIILLFGESIDYLPFGNTMYYIFNTNTNKVMGPNYINGGYVYFLPLKDGRCIVSQSTNTLNISVYSNWNIYPENFIIPISNDSLYKELESIEKNKFFEGKDFASQKLYKWGYWRKSMLLDDNRLMTWTWNDKFKKVKIYPLRNQVR